MKRMVRPSLLHHAYVLARSTILQRKLNRHIRTDHRHESGFPHLRHARLRAAHAVRAVLLRDMHMLFLVR